MATPLQQTIIGLERRVWDAVMTRNGAALQAMFSDDYVEVTVEGSRVTRTMVVEQSPNVDEIDSAVMTESRVLPLGESAAVLSYRLNLDGRLRGQAIEPHERWVTSVWRCIDSEWQCVLFQQTAVSDPS